MYFQLPELFTIKYSIMKSVGGVMVINATFNNKGVWFSKYSQTCIKRSPLG